jgi:hypothetical protein
MNDGFFWFLVGVWATVFVGALLTSITVEVPDQTCNYIATDNVILLANCD